MTSLSFQAQSRRRKPAPHSSADSASLLWVKRCTWNVLLGYPSCNRRWASCNKKGACNRTSKTAPPPTCCHTASKCRRSLPRASEPPEPAGCASTSSIRDLLNRYSFCCFIYGNNMAAAIRPREPLEFVEEETPAVDTASVRRMS